MGNCHRSKTSVNPSFASVDIGLLGVTINHVTLPFSETAVVASSIRALAPQTESRVRIPAMIDLSQ